MVMPATGCSSCFDWLYRNRGFEIWSGSRTFGRWLCAFTEIQDNAKVGLPTNYNQLGVQFASLLVSVHSTSVIGKQILAGSVFETISSNCELP